MSTTTGPAHCRGCQHIQDYPRALPRYHSGAVTMSESCLVCMIGHAAAQEVEIELKEVKSSQKIEK